MLADFISKCHGAPVRSEGNVTMHYVCTECNQPCDVTKGEDVAMADKLAKAEQDKKDEKEQRIKEAREAVRTALTHYETVLDVAQSTEQSVSKRDHLLVSHAQVRSAKRVLWFEN